MQPSSVLEMFASVTCRAISNMVATYILSFDFATSEKFEYRHMNIVNNYNSYVCNELHAIMVLGY